MENIYIEFWPLLNHFNAEKLCQATYFSLLYPSVLLVRKLFPRLIMSMFIFSHGKATITFLRDPLNNILIQLRRHPLQNGLVITTTQHYNYIDKVELVEQNENNEKKNNKQTFAKKKLLMSY